jgi:hypothetical protein
MATYYLQNNAQHSFFSPTTWNLIWEVSPFFNLDANLCLTATRVGWAWVSLANSHSFFLHKCRRQSIFSAGFEFDQTKDYRNGKIRTANFSAKIQKSRELMVLTSQLSWPLIYTLLYF